MELIYYNGEHSVKFGDSHQGYKDSWTDWHLIPTSKPVIAPPTVKTKQVDIPGVYCVIDLTTVLTGYPIYGNRTGSLEFILAPGFESWESVKTKVMEYLGGRSMTMILSDEKYYYYIGTFAVGNLKADARNYGITINYDLYPFKRSLYASDDPWLWDPFNFETGIIYDFSSLNVDGELTIRIEDCIEPVTPQFVSSDNMTLRHTFMASDGVTPRVREYQLKSGISEPTTLRPGLNLLQFVGTGVVRLHYRSGRL